MESLKINEEKINVNTEADSPEEEAGRDIIVSPLAPFFVAFIIFIITVLPFLIKYKGIWIYYGDFNVQQIPFYIHLHDVIRSGNIWYDWGTDLGGSVVGCYSFYILGSPFFWLTIPFKSETVIYLLPWINALKYGVMALTSYLWLRRNTKSDIGAFAGAMLYTFSGYSGAVLVYNHFHDVCAFFPLWLLLFDRLMQEKRRIGFILMTGFMAILNYYFFVGEALFLIIYFFCRYFYDGNPGAIKRGFARIGRALYCSVAGVLCAVWYL
ncbi:MAG: YfhO family protein, partial [Lachnospiraceae bacterium]|nr:YfhO family protein [Lachnospiraceae bacterium]